MLTYAVQAFLMDTPGIMQTSMSTEHGLKLALTGTQFTCFTSTKVQMLTQKLEAGAIKDSIVDIITLAEYLLFALNKHGQVCYCYY